MNDLPVFLINLDGSNDRLNAATAALKAQGSAFQRHAAFDGRTKALTDIAQYDATATRRVMGRGLTGGEVGCFISHVEAAQRFVQTNAPFGLVLEDDMQPTPQALALTRALIADQTADIEWGLAHLAAPTVKISTILGQITAAGQTAMLHRAHYFPMRTTALLWTRSGAQRFVTSAYPITCPVDIHLRRWLRKDDSGIAVTPAFFTTTEAESEIAAASDAKRGGDSRSALYPFKRAARMITDKLHAHALKRRTSKGPVK